MCGTAPRLRGWFSERWGGGRVHVEHNAQYVLPQGHPPQRYAPQDQPIRHDALLPYEDGGGVVAAGVYVCRKASLYCR